ncbi:hypothetical protein ADUPG1_006778, partial [Aduncisulcus paluster]
HRRTKKEKVVTYRGTEPVSFGFCLDVSGNISVADRTDIVSLHTDLKLEFTAAQRDSMTEQRAACYARNSHRDRYCTVSMNEKLPGLEPHARCVSPNIKCSSKFYAQQNCVPFFVLLLTFLIGQSVIYEAIYRLISIFMHRDIKKRIYTPGEIAQFQNDTRAYQDFMQSCTLKNPTVEDYYSAYSVYGVPTDGVGTPGAFGSGQNARYPAPDPSAPSIPMPVGPAPASLATSHGDTGVQMTQRPDYIMTPLYAFDVQQEMPATDEFAYVPTDL